MDENPYQAPSDDDPKRSAGARWSDAGDIAIGVAATVLVIGAWFWLVSINRQ